MPLSSADLRKLAGFHGEHSASVMPQHLCGCIVPTYGSAEIINVT